MKKITHTAILFLLAFGPMTLFAQLTEQWSYTYDGKGNGEEELFALELDDYGNTFLLAVTDTGFLDNAATVIKLDTAGNLVWQSFVQLNGNSPDPTGMVLDTDSNVYISGYYNSPGNFSSDVFLVKFSPEGDQLWASYFQSPGNTLDDCNGMAVDNSGNLVLFGQTGTSAAGYDFLVLKYDTAGTKIWDGTFDHPNNKSDDANAMAIDADNSIYICGKNINTGVSGSDFLTVKFDSMGVALWHKTYDDSLMRDDACNSIVIDNNGDIIVTGESFDWGPGYPVYKVATIKYDSSGNEKWVTRFRASNSTTIPSKIVADNNNSLYVSASAYYDLTAFDALLIKYDASGNEVFTRRVNGNNNSFDDGNDVMVGANGLIYMAGSVENTNTYADGFVQVYNTIGDSLMQKQWNSSQSDDDYFQMLRMDHMGAVIVAGQIEKLNDLDLVVVKYSGPASLSVSKEKLNHSLAIFPNPSQGTFTVKLPASGHDLITITLTDLTGKIVFTKTKTINVSQTELTIKTNDLSSGIYSVSVQSKGENFTGKHVIR